MAQVVTDLHRAFNLVSDIIKIIDEPESSKTARNVTGSSAAANASDVKSAPPADDAITRYHQLIMNSPAVRDNPVEFCLASIVKEARQEDLLAKQLLLAKLSAYTKNPLNMCINAPSGEGKNYVINKVAEKFPSDDVLTLAGMTDKALFHRRGELVIKNPQTKNYEPLMPMIAVINKAIAEKARQLREMEKEKKGNVSARGNGREKTSTGDNGSSIDHATDLQANPEESSNSRGQESKALEKEILDLKEHRASLFSQAKKMINLENKILIFLDTPSQTLLSTLTFDARYGSPNSSQQNLRTFLRTRYRILSSGVACFCCNIRFSTR